MVRNPAMAPSLNRHPLRAPSHRAGHIRRTISSRSMMFCESWARSREVCGPSGRIDFLKAECVGKSTSGDARNKDRQLQIKRNMKYAVDEQRYRRPLRRLNGRPCEQRFLKLRRSAKRALRGTAFQFMAALFAIPAFQFSLQSPSIVYRIAAA